jgi:hypothetical protein
MTCQKNIAVAVANRETGVFVIVPLGSRLGRNVPTIFRRGSASVHKRPSLPPPKGKVDRRQYVSAHGTGEVRQHPPKSAAPFNVKKELEDGSGARRMNSWLLPSGGPWIKKLLR